MLAREVQNKYNILQKTLCERSHPLHMAGWNADELQVLKDLQDSYQSFTHIFQNRNALVRWMSEHLPRRNYKGLFRKLRCLNVTEDKMRKIFGPDLIPESRLKHKPMPFVKHSCGVVKKITAQPKSSVQHHCPVRQKITAQPKPSVQHNCPVGQKITAQPKSSSVQGHKPPANDCALVQNTKRESKPTPKLESLFENTTQRESKRIAVEKAQDKLAALCWVYNEEMACETEPPMQILAPDGV